MRHTWLVCHKDWYRLALTTRRLQRAPRAPIQHLPAYLLHMLYIPIHVCHKTVETARTFSIRYRPAYSCQVPATQVDHQSHHVCLKVLILWTILERISKLVQNAQNRTTRNL